MQTLRQSMEKQQDSAKEELGCCKLALFLQATLSLAKPSLVLASENLTVSMILGGWEEQRS